MLLELDIRNFALVEHANLEFTGTFTVMTGETGAGKSILLDALGLALGERTSPDVVRHGATAARVQARFDLSCIPDSVKSIAEQLIWPIQCFGSFIDNSIEAFDFAR